MDWVKRNLYWVIGGGVALGLLGFSGYYLYSNLQQEKAIDEELTRQLEEWANLEKAKPHPDDASIDAAKEDLKRVQSLLADHEHCCAGFEYPGAGDSLEFKKLLETAVDQLRRQAKESDVLIQTNYYFSFEAQRLPTQYDPASLRPLTERLTEVKTICDVLFKAKVKSLESVQRVSTGKDDTTPTDLISLTQTNTTLATVTPYQVTFVAFTSQLGDVINGFAHSHHCILVKSVNVTTNAPVTGKPPGSQDSETGDAAPTQADLASRMMRRYGVPGAGAGAGTDASMQQRMMMRYGNRYRSSAPDASTPSFAPAVPAKTGPETVLEEVPLRAVMHIEVVKVLPASERGKAKPAARAAPSDPAGTDQPAAPDTSAEPAN